MKYKKAPRLVFINFGVFLLFLGFAEIVSRAYEAISPDSQYQHRLQQQISQESSQDSSCKPPPIVTDSGNLSRYLEDFSCDGVSIQDGLRLTVDSPIKPSKTIHVFGGSTVFGTGSKDSETIPSYMQKVLNDNGFNIAVKNYGFMTLVASQQLAALKAANLQPGDIVLFYDGGNDAFNSFVYGSPQGTIIGYNRNNKLAFALVKARHYLQSNSALYRVLGALKADISGKNSPSDAQCSDIPNDSSQDSYVNHYFSVLADSKSYAKSKGVEFLHSFQPILGSSNGLSTDESSRVLELLSVDGIARCTQDNLLGYYSLLSEKYDKYLGNVNGLNLSSVFAGSASPFAERYIDWIHMTPAANKKIAEKLIHHILLNANYAQ